MLLGSHSQHLSTGCAEHSLVLAFELYLSPFARLQPNIVNAEHVIRINLPSVRRKPGPTCMSTKTKDAAPWGGAQEKDPHLRSYSNRVRLFSIFSTSRKISCGGMVKELRSGRDPINLANVNAWLRRKRSGKYMTYRGVKRRCTLELTLGKGAGQNA